MDFKELSKINIQDVFKKTGGDKKNHGRALSSVLGLDFGVDAVNAVRLKKNAQGVELLGVDVLPLPSRDDDSMRIPLGLRESYAALCSDFPDSKARVFSYTPQGEYVLTDVVRSNLNVTDDFRAKGLLLKESRKEHLILGVATPMAPIERMLALFSDGPPALCTVELSGLASAAALFFQKGTQAQPKTVCVLEGGEISMTASFFVNNQLKIVNQFALGAEGLLEEVKNGLGVDTETAVEIARGDAVDISSFVQKKLGVVSKQLSISKEFVERQTHSSLSVCYLSGELALFPAFGVLIETALESSVEIWNPFETFILPEEGLPEAIQGRETLFASAVGAALSSLES